MSEIAKWFMTAEQIMCIVFIAVAIMAVLPILIDFLVTSQSQKKREKQEEERRKRYLKALKELENGFKTFCENTDNFINKQP